jgi:hypothetical protein
VSARDWGSARPGDIVLYNGETSIESGLVIGVVPNAYRVFNNGGSRLVKEMDHRVTVSGNSGSIDLAAKISSAEHKSQVPLVGKMNLFDKSSNKEKLYAVLGGVANERANHIMEKVLTEMGDVTLDITSCEVRDSAMDIISSEARVSFVISDFIDTADNRRLLAIIGAGKAGLVEGMGYRLALLELDKGPNNVYTVVLAATRKDYIHPGASASITDYVDHSKNDPVYWRQPAKIFSETAKEAVSKILETVVIYTNIKEHFSKAHVQFLMGNYKDTVDSRMFLSMHACVVCGMGESPENQIVLDDIAVKDNYIIVCVNIIPKIGIHREIERVESFIDESGEEVGSIQNPHSP